MIGLDGRRLAAVARKEIREYRRTPFIIGAMAVLPFVFLINPVIVIFVLGASVRSALVARDVGSTFLVLLVVPAVIPATVAAYSVVGERDQGTLEPLLTTPVRRAEILIGKALAPVVPSVGIAHLLFAPVVVAAHFFAQNPAVATTLTDSSHILAQALFAPLLAVWSIGVGVAISARSSDVRIAQQLGTLANGRDSCRGEARFGRAQFVTAARATTKPTRVAPIAATVRRSRAPVATPSTTANAA